MTDPRAGDEVLLKLLDDAIAGDHARGCAGRSYSCTCGYDTRVAVVLSYARQALARQSAGYAEDGGRPLPYTRDELGRMVREAWVRWAKEQPNPKPTWLVPYSDLSEPDKEADRQIGESIARWTLIGDAASRALAAVPPGPQAEVERAKHFTADKLATWLLDQAEDIRAAYPESMPSEEMAAMQRFGDAAAMLMDQQAALRAADAPVRLCYPSDPYCNWPQCKCWLNPATAADESGVK